MTLIIASNNAHKVREIGAMAAGRFERVLTMKEAGLDLDVEETGSTFQENALLKAQAVANAAGQAALADDSGLEVFALGGEPGVYSARYCGWHGDDEANNRKLLERMASVPDGRRAARYVCAVALVRPGLKTLTAWGECPGVILREPRGHGGFGYDPLFYLPELHCTMAELTPEQKNAISHRHHALQALLRLLAAEGRTP